MKIGQLCQIEHTPWISISYILFFVFYNLTKLPYFHKVYSKKEGKSKRFHGRFSKSGQVCQICKTYVSGTCFTICWVKTNPGCSMFQDGNAKSHQHTDALKGARMYWFSMCVTKGNIGSRTYSNPGELAIGMQWFHGELGSRQAGFMASWVHFTLGSLRAGFYHLLTPSSYGNTKYKWKRI